MFGFGLLLDSEELKITVPDAHNFRPAYIKGFRRDFSFWDSVGWTKTNLDLAGEAFCAVDVKIISSPQLKVNGVIFQMNESNHEKLLQRELGYELIKTTAYHFEDNVAIGECFLFSSNMNSGVYDFNSEAQKRYLEICLKGASQFGRNFYEEFLNTTFISGQRLNEISSLTKICNKYS